MPSTSSPPPLIQNRYQLAEWLDSGATSLVYRAEDTLLARQVVIKFITTAQEDPTVTARFLREARTVARLSHPHIMAIYDVGEQEGWSYLVLEYISGGNLHKLRLQQGGSLPVKDALGLVRQVLGALVYAHGMGIIHRDIKPENILLTPQGEVKVADFGLALAHGEARLTQTGAVVGTALYLPPEALRGVTSDPRSDLYSLGAVLYELLTGRPPFEGESIMEVIGQMVSGTPRPPGELNAAITPPVEEYLLRLLGREPELRHASAAEALRALDELIAQETSTPEAPVLLLLGGGSGAAAVLENERHRLAGLIQESIIGPISLLLAQAAAFEQTLAGSQSTRMAVSVLGTLARQVLQQARDLEASLHPAVLDTLGLEAALEALAERVERTYGLALDLDIARLPARLPSGYELVLFRFIQEMLEKLSASHTQRAGLRLGVRAEHAILEIAYPADKIPAKVTKQSGAGLEALGARVETSRAASGEERLSVSLPLAAAALNFTRREQEVLQCLVEGLENKAIAERLVISPRTVGFHMDNIFAKLGVRSRTEAAVIALSRGLVRRPSEPV